MSESSKALSMFLGLDFIVNETMFEEIAMETRKTWGEQLLIKDKNNKLQIK